MISCFFYLDTNDFIKRRLECNFLLGNHNKMDGQQQTKPLKGQKKTFDPREPAPLSNRINRPWRGIFLSFFLFFCGLLFFTHGLHRYNDYTTWQLITVWTLSALLLIPGIYFVVIIIGIELKASGFSYKNHPELYQ